jgi:Prion-inhibition and propagation/NACHT domain
MEVAGLVLGAVGLAGLAGLLGSCIQLVDQIPTGIDLTQDADLLERKWSLEIHLLKRWARMAGIADGRVNSEHRKELDEQEIRDEVLATLMAIERLLRDHEKLAERYGLDVRPELGSPTKPQSVQLIRRRWRRNCGRMRWIVHDKNKFEILVNDLSFFVRKMYLVVPPPDPLVDDLCTNFAQLLSVSTRTVANNVGLGEQSTTLRELIQLSLGKLSLHDLLATPQSEESRRSKRELALQGAETLVERSISFEKDQRLLVEQLDGIQRVQILQWLDATSTDNEYDTACRSRCKGTCEWILRRSEFQLWVGNVPESNYSKSYCSWISGNAGSGKTFLSARLVEYFKVSRALPFAHFFCTFDRGSNRPEAILRSWVSQIAMSHKAALKVVQDFREGHETRPPTVSRLWAIYSRIIKVVRNCRFLVDGFDECIRSDPAKADFIEDLRSDFLEELMDRTKDTTARVMIVSRDVSYVRSILDSWPDNVSILELTRQDTEGDLRTFANDVVEKQLGKKESTLKTRIADKLASKAEGMFLWVRLEMPRLKSRMSTEQLHRVLDSALTGAKTLERAYGRCLQEIVTQQENSDVKRALDVLRWTLYSLVPLDVVELMEILEFSEEEALCSVGAYDEPAVTSFIDEVLQICQPLLRLDKIGDEGTGNGSSKKMLYFRLSHFSVKEYLTGVAAEEFGPGRCLSFQDKCRNHGYCAELCARYLSQQEFAEPGPTLRKKLESYTYKFMEYASCYGIQHAQLGQDSQGSFGPLFVDPSLTGNFAVWTRFWSVSWKHPAFELRIKAENPRVSPDYADRRSFIPSLWFAALLGATGVVECLLAAGHDPNECAEAYVVNQDLVFGRGNCIFAAIASGNSTVVQLILQSKKIADLLSLCCTYVGSTTRGLLEPLVSCNYRRKPSGIITNPMGVAIHFQSVESVQLLLDCGFNVNHKPETFMSPLRQAFGHIGIVKILLGHGADVDDPNEPYGTVLQAAAKVGLEPVVRLLLTHGAGVNKISGEDGTAFRATQHTGIIRLLENAGADRDLMRKDSPELTYDRIYHSTEQFASEKPQTALARGGVPPITENPLISLLPGYSHMGRSSDGSTVLHHVCRLLRYQPSIFSQIPAYLATGADINTASDGGTPLEFLVAQREDPHHIEYFLQNGADPRLLSADCISLLTAKPYSRFIYSTFHHGGGRWIEYPPSATNQPRWSAEALHRVKTMLQECGLDDPMVYFDSENWVDPNSFDGFTRGLITSRGAQKLHLITFEEN